MNNIQTQIGTTAKKKQSPQPYQIRLKMISLIRLVVLPSLQFASILKQGGTNHRNTGYTSVPRSSKGYSHTYNTRMRLSRLQRIYRQRHLTLGVVDGNHLAIVIN